MKAIVVTRPGAVALQELPVPVPQGGQVRIRTAACGICATDLEIIRGSDRMSYPAVPGHEWSGTVDAVGSGVSGDLVGRYCVAENVWRDGGEVGFEHPGGYAECFITEAGSLHFLPADYPRPLAALIEPLAVAVRAVHRLRIADKSSVLIIGDGPIGLLLTLLLKQADVVHVTVIGGRDNRLAVARKFGAERTLNYHALGDGGLAAAQSALGGAFPNVIEATGAKAAVELALEQTRTGAKVLIVGEYRRLRANFPWNRIVHRELELIGTNASAEAWPEAVRIAEACPGRLSELVSHEWPAREFRAALHAAGTDRSVIKAILRWDR